MNRHLKLALDVLAEVESGACGPSLQRRAGEARAMLQRRKRANKTMPESVKVKEKVSAERESAEGRRQSKVYAEVERRADGLCEVTGFPAVGLNRLVNHHIIYGQGVDRDKVTQVHLVIRVLDSVHKAIHANPSLYEAELLRWCKRYGYRRARDEIERRAFKQQEAGRALAKAEDPIVACPCGAITTFRLFQDKDVTTQTPDGRLHSVLVCERARASRAAEKEDA